MAISCIPAAAPRRPAAADPMERERIVAEYLPRVAALARRFRAPGVDFDDLVQEGCLALLEALVRYEPERGVPFWAYAKPWVHGAISRACSEQRLAVRLPAAARVEVRLLAEARERLGRRGGTRPPLSAVAREAGLEPERAERLLMAARPPRSLEGSDSADEGPTLLESIPDDGAEAPHDEVAVTTAAHDVGPLLAGLSPREREVLTARFGIGRLEETLADVGRRFGVTRERARQIEARALDKLREALA